MLPPTLNQKENNFIRNQFIVKYRKGTDTKIMKEIHRQIGAIIMEEDNLLGFQVISSHHTLRQLSKYYRQFSVVKYVKRNSFVRIA